MSKKVSIVEVGPRDGLQNEKVTLSGDVRLQFVEGLVAAGVQQLEIGAFVSKQWVPQMADSSELIVRALTMQASGLLSTDAVFSALVPNLRGMEDALKTGVRRVAVFGSASESFSRKNINCSIEESFQRFSQVVEIARAHQIKVRGYLSMAFGCPFEGDVPESQVVRLAKRMIDLGIYEVSIGDTIGIADPSHVRRLVRKLVDGIGVEHLAMHFHDTRGTALANILASLDLGVRVFDSSLGGLGGCPYAPAATGNVATEDVCYMLERMGFETNIQIEKLIELNRWMEKQVGRDLPSRVGKAGLPKAKGAIA